MYDPTTRPTGGRRAAVAALTVVGLIVLTFALIWATVSCSDSDKKSRTTGSTSPSAAATGGSAATGQGGDDAGNGPGDGDNGGATAGPNAGSSTGGGAPGTGTASPGTTTGKPGLVLPSLLTIPPLSIMPAAEDCVSYNPANLSVQNAGSIGWRVVDGTHALLLLDTEADAVDGTRVGHNYRQLCFIGRDNTRAERYRYLSYYWKTPSGLPAGLTPHTDCISYDPAKLKITSNGTTGWILGDGGQSLLLLDDAADAARARLVATGNSKLCFIGRDNSRPDRYRYIVEYWRS